MGRSGEGQDGVGWRGWGLCSPISHSHQVLLCSGSHLGVLAMVGKSFRKCLSFKLWPRDDCLTHCVSSLHLGQAQVQAACAAKHSPRQSGH